MAYAQTDFKRLVAYTSVSHLGFVLLGIFAGNPIALQGAILQMICHGLSTGGLFILAGSIQERIHTRDLRRMGGFWKQSPRMGSAGFFLSFASLGLPGLGNFVAEFLILLGTYQTHPVFGVLASLGLITSALYSLRMLQTVFLGPVSEENLTLSDLSWRETGIVGVLIIALLWIGFYPQPLLETVSLKGVENVDR